MSDKHTLPNFLIVGMAKCATTSLAKSISQHPEIFISERKEPRFITSICGRIPKNGPKDHLVSKWYVKDFETYKELFSHRKEKAIGEASADTLYFYRETIPVIKKYIGSPKIIIILRDPVNRAFSAYKHLVRDQREFLSFEDALKKEQERIDSGWELIYHYTQASYYAPGIQAFKKHFDNVLVLLSEDLRKDPHMVLRKVFEFLEVDPSVMVEQLMELNISGKPKSQLLHTTLETRGWLAAIGRPFGRLFFKTPEKRAAVRERIRKWNLKNIELSPKTEKTLRQLFKDDILRTEEITGYDLKEWYAGNVKS